MGGHISPCSPLCGFGGFWWWFAGGGLPGFLRRFWGVGLPPCIDSHDKGRVVFYLIKAAQKGRH